MCILDRSRYTACCEINHIFRTESEDLIERVKSFQEERELYSSFDLQAEISISGIPINLQQQYLRPLSTSETPVRLHGYLLTSFITS